MKTLWQIYMPHSAAYHVIGLMLDDLISIFYVLVLQYMGISILNVPLSVKNGHFCDSMSVLCNMPISIYEKSVVNLYPRNGLVQQINA